MTELHVFQNNDSKKATRHCIRGECEAIRHIHGVYLAEVARISLMRHDEKADEGTSSCRWGSALYEEYENRVLRLQHSPAHNLEDWLAKSSLLSTFLQDVSESIDRNLFHALQACLADVRRIVGMPHLVWTRSIGEVDQSDA